MKIRSIAFAAAALWATSAALAVAPTPARKLAGPQPLPREQVLVEALAAQARAILSAVTPEISLPKLELTLSPLERDAG